MVPVFSKNPGRDKRGFGVLLFAVVTSSFLLLYSSNALVASSDALVTSREECLKKHNFGLETVPQYDECKMLAPCSTGLRVETWGKITSGVTVSIY